MTTLFPTKDDMLKERAMYDKAIEGLPKDLYSDLLKEYEEWEYGLEAKKKLAIKNINLSFKEMIEESYKKVDRLFDKARYQSGLKGDCEISNGFKSRLEQTLRKIIEAL